MRVNGSYVHSNSVTYFPRKKNFEEIHRFLGSVCPKFSFFVCQTLLKEFNSLDTLKSLLLRATVSKFIQSRNVDNL